MKATTEQIRTLLNNLSFLNSNLLEGISDTRILSVSYQEQNFKESLESFQYYRELFVEFIEKNPIIFERIVLYSTRTAILNTLSKLQQLGQQFKPQLINIPLSQQNISQIIAQIISFQQMIVPLNMESYSKHAQNYYKKLTEITYLTNRYKKLEKQLSDIEKLYIKINEYHEFSQTVNENLKIIQKNAESIINKTSAVLKDIEARYESIKNINKNTLELEASSKQNSETIQQFYNEVDKFRSLMNEGLKQIQDSINQFETTNSQKLVQNNKVIQDFISGSSEKTSNIITQNEKLQQDILGILGKAIGTKLYKSFEEKATSLKWISWIWLGFLVLSLVGLTIIGYNVVDELITADTPFEKSFYLRVTVLFPIIYAIYFFATLYKTANKIKEEYDFKSAVSVSLHHFRDIIEDSKSNPETQTFLKDSVSKIFSSPTDIVFGRQKIDKDINDKVENTVEKIVSLANSIITKK